MWQVAWAHPQFGSLLASGGFDRRVVVQRELAPGSWGVIFAYDGHASSVNSVAWAPAAAGLRLAAASSDGRVTVFSHNAGNDSWDVVTLDDCPLGTNAVAWAPPHAGAALATAGCDGAVRVWRATPTPPGPGGEPPGERWAVDAVLAGPHREWVRDVAWCPGAVGGPGGDAHDAPALASASDDGVVAVWRLVGGPGAGAGGWRPDALPTFPAPVWRVSWSVSGRLLAVSCGDNSITLWKESLSGAWQQATAVPDPTLAVSGR